MYPWVVKLEKELVAASATGLALSILREGDSYGYAIIQRVRELSDGEMEWTDGMLYPILHWLEDKGQIRGRWEKAEGRRRRYYAITKRGEEALAGHQDQWSVVIRTFGKVWGTKYA